MAERKQIIFGQTMQRIEFSLRQCVDTVVASKSKKQTANLIETALNQIESTLEQFTRDWQQIILPDKMRPINEEMVSPTFLSNFVWLSITSLSP